MAKDSKQPSLHRRNKTRKQVKTYGKQISRCEEMVRSLSLVQSRRDDIPMSSPRGRNERLIQSAPNPFPLRRGVLEEHIRSRAWSGIEHLRSSERMVPDKPTDDRVSERLPDPSHLTPEGLCESLRARGFGDPRIRMVWADTTDRQCLPDIRKRRKKAMRIPYYMEKIRGQARTDFDSAARKAKEFCDEELHRVTLVRRAKVNAGFQMLVEEEEGVPESIEDTVHGGIKDASEGGLTKEEMFQRISQWIEDVDKARKNIRRSSGRRKGVHP